MGAGNWKGKGTQEVILEITMLFSCFCRHIFGLRERELGNIRQQSYERQARRSVVNSLSVTCPEDEILYWMLNAALTEPVYLSQIAAHELDTVILASSLDYTLYIPVVALTIVCRLFNLASQNFIYSPESYILLEDYLIELGYNIPNSRFGESKYSLEFH